MLVGNGTDIPPEIWDRVFKYCVRIFRWYADGPTFVPKSRLHPLLFVCKEWHGIAERRLYSSVSLGSDRVVKDRNGQKMEIKGKDVALRFCETVQSNPRLASLVRELQMGVRVNNVEESEVHIRLIGACKNVEKIEMYGCMKALANDLRAALVKADLVSLSLYTHVMGEFLGSRGGEQLFSMTELVRLLPNWPRIENVSASFDEGYGYGSLGGSPSKGSESPPKEGTCPVLKSISVHGGVFCAAQLVELGSIAPNLESLSITVRDDGAEALRGCLQAWSSSLKRLTVFSPTYSRVPTGVGCPVIRSRMAELRELSGYHPMFTAEAIALAPKLEKLHFRGEYRDGTELARRIEKGELPCLKEIDVYFSKPKSESISDEEDEKICVEIATELRKMCRKRSVFVKDLFTEVEDLEEYYGYPESEPESLDNDWCDYEISDPPDGVTDINEEDHFPSNLIPSEY